MRVKILSLAAAALLLAACETTPSGTGTTGTGGATAPRTAPATPATQATRGPTPGSQEDLVVNVGDRVFFDFDKSDVRPAGQQVLQKQAAWLKTYPNVTLTIEGHADERGTREYNLALGDRRANSVKNYLVALGIQGNRLRTISYGKERPAVLGSNEAAWSQNRRGVSVVN
ncbi:MAG: peptidoglycan-associated lipoprotein Pal [Alphaproteobacteria bacterium]|nr:peptidoglycan-associated lipoprotein Pal [Alphaproteobacteria bacterium]